MDARLREDLLEDALRARDYEDLADLYAESGQTSQGSFSAVSKPNFARKCALENSRRDLHNALLCTALHRSLISIFSSKIAIFFASEFMNIH